MEPRKIGMKNKALISPGQANEYIKVSSPSYFIIMGALMLLFLSVICWAFFGRITDKAYISGVIFPQEGTVGVNIPNSGTVRNVFVHKGDHITKGQALALVSIQDSYSIISATEDGTVLSFKLENESFQPFEDILTILPFESSEEILTVIGYADFTTQRKLRKGMEAQVTPSYESRERIGYVKGSVTEIAPYPISRNEAVEDLRNESIANEIFPESGSAFPISIELNSKNGKLDWSFKSEDYLDMSVGTYCNIEVIVKSRSFFHYLLENIRSRKNSLNI